MNNTDKTKFKELMDALSELYGKDKPSVLQLQMTFAALERYKFDQISEAASKHVSKSKFFPRPADLIEILDGCDITIDQVLASAKLANTPMGVLARIYIGSWDLDSQDGFYLRQKAEECLQMIPEWTERAKLGQYTDHEISIMIKRGVSPLSPFAFGVSPPSNAQQIESRIQEISKTPNHSRLIESSEPKENNKTSGMAPNIKKFIAELEADEDAKKSKLWGDL